MLPAISNEDLHNVNAMTSFGSDDEKDAVVVSDFENDNDNNVIEPEDVVRCFRRVSDIKYLFMFEGRKILLSAEQVELQFIGVKFALWTYWKKRSRHRVSNNKVINHLKLKGAAGFHREILWHLLLDAMYFQLIALRRKNKLHT
ncbi:hypothetical protein QFC20_004080 [Naganishia adeliensis]|uniref:Uncharacterized protein n=1 Tax=Naganishia adeliensis TaxID=92952 RepID=A0ACC2W668_9TREE|nr:hypothetical protein QFC20_004080 [Naganishia adeliensis]